ncbi:FCD domain-containing protein [Paenibacillus naphthalenovorans]|uniref:FCD domain-containing protein n=1 Tax=Paenibacillus naphthalenovorans TaxID=162209 RepID=UPI003D2BE9CF
MGRPYSFYSLSKNKFTVLRGPWFGLSDKKTQLDTIDAVLRRMEEPGISIVDYANLNRDFHRIIHEASGLSYIQGLVEEHWDFFEYAAALDKVFKEHRMARSLLEHRMIFHSLKDGNSTLAKQLMEQHVVRVAYLVKEESG